MDLVLASGGLVVVLPLIALAWLVAAIDTRDTGFFRQQRVGRNGDLFEVLKIRTMRAGAGTTVTTSTDARITRSGAFFRRTKIDELPQLINVIRGDMSLVGPRPDVPGFADLLTGGDRVLLSVRPGMTSPAAVAFRHEQEILAGVADPELYNKDVLWPAKVEINRAYVENWTLTADLKCLLATAGSMLARRPREGADQ
ncbi:sugar transferase [Nocardioides sp. GCM10027113]|uniref:sugar transferase n=1 Tax=unclassified Nocardioides TaxID=2615069 RepID=UPI003617CDDE